MIQKIPWSTLRKDQRDMLKNMIKLIPQVDLLEANLDASQILFQFQLINLNSRAFSKLQQHQPTVMTSALPPSVNTGIASFELKPIIVPRLTP